MTKLLVIVGPTGTGKTALALQLAKKFNGELVSADSRQIYKGMDIGTGKVDPALKKEKRENFWLVDSVKIHLFDLIDPDETFSVAAFQEKAYQAIEQITQEGKLPILVGGTGLYVQAVIEGLKFPKVKPDLKLRNEMEKKSTERLLAMLEEVDPETFKKIDQNNRRRMIRALEVSKKTGKAFSEVKARVKANFDTLVIGLNGEREKLYKKIDKRIDQWFDSGLFQKEVEQLLKNYPVSLTAFTSLGYQDMMGLLEGRLTEAEARQRTKFKHHGYVRAQLTWFRKMPAVTWLDIFGFERKEIFNLIKKWLEQDNSQIAS